MIIFGLLQKIPFEMCPRTPFLRHIMNGPFSALFLFWPSLCLRLGLVFAFDTLRALLCAASCWRLLLKMSVSSRRNAYFYVPLQMLNDISLSKIRFLAFKNGLKPCFLTHFRKPAFWTVSLLWCHCFGGVGGLRPPTARPGLLFDAF